MRARGTDEALPVYSLFGKAALIGSCPYGESCRGYKRALPPPSPPARAPPRSLGCGGKVGDLNACASQLDHGFIMTDADFYSSKWSKWIRGMLSLGVPDPPRCCFGCCLVLSRKWTAVRLCRAVCLMPPPSLPAAALAAGDGTSGCSTHIPNCFHVLLVFCPVALFFSFFSERERESSRQLAYSTRHDSLSCLHDSMLPKSGPELG